MSLTSFPSTIMFSFSWLVAACTLGSLAQLDALVEAQNPLELGGSRVTAKYWEDLGHEVGGRLIQVKPFAEPCFSNPFNSSECLAVRNVYLDEGEI